jgi:hypothetical protein
VFIIENTGPVQRRYTDTSNHYAKSPKATEFNAANGSVWMDSGGKSAESFMNPGVNLLTFHL